LIGLWDILADVRGGEVPLLAGRGQQQIERIVHWVRLSIRSLTHVMQSAI